MLNNAYLLAKIGADTAENEQRFAEMLPIGRSAGRPARAPRGPGLRGRADGAGAHQTPATRPKQGLRALTFLPDLAKL